MLNFVERQSEINVTKKKEIKNRRISRHSFPRHSQLHLQTTPLPTIVFYHIVLKSITNLVNCLLTDH